jgi:hypothetical protein
VWLVERVRSGRLSVDRVELAALLFHPAAKQYLGAHDPLVQWTETVGIWNVDRWLRKVAGWGLLPSVRAAIAAGRKATLPSDPPWVLETLAAAEAWTLDPSAERVEAVHRVVKSAPRGVRRSRRERLVSELALSLAEALHAGRAPIGAAKLAGKVADPVETRLAICDEVGRWALGYADPVAERVSRRGRAG